MDRVKPRPLADCSTASVMLASLSRLIKKGWWFITLDAIAAMSRKRDRCKGMATTSLQKDLR